MKTITIPAKTFVVYEFDELPPDTQREIADDYDAQSEYMRTVDWFAERARALELCFTADGDQYIGGDAA